jgi:predicted Zn-dependent protease
MHFFLFLALLLFAPPLHAATLIRDTETEALLGEYLQAVLKAADLPQGSVRLHLMHDDTINAFVANGSHMFINTGLLLNTPTPEMLIGVIAHETGHIAGGHLINTEEEATNTRLQTMATTVLAAVAAAASRSGELGTAVLSAGQHIAEQNFLAYSREQEQTADEAGLGYLTTLHVSPKGMLEVMETLRKQETFHFGQDAPWLRTHPLSRERIAHIRGRLATQPTSTHPRYADWQARHARVIAKLYAFLRSPDETWKHYPKADDSVPAQLAHAIAYYRESRVTDALAAMDRLIARFPEDAYLYELKGQFLYEFGRVKEAIPVYARAVELAPHASLIGVDYARALLGSDSGTPRDQAAKAIAVLERAKAQEPDQALLWQTMARAYDQHGDAGEVLLARAEEAFLTGNLKETLALSQEAQQKLSHKSPSWLRAQDLHLQAEEAQRKKKEE